MAPPPLTEEDTRFLATYDPSVFPRPSVAVDVVLLTADGGTLEVVLVQRHEPPFRDTWTLPGVFVGPRETLEEAAERALRKTGIDPAAFPHHLEQLYTFGAPDRDPRGRVVSVAYFALVPPARLAALGADARLFPVDATGSLPFDHGAIVAFTVERLRGKLGWTDVGFALLPEVFALRDLQRLHETILGRALNKDSFRRSMLATGLLVPTGGREDAVGHRPAALYRYQPRDPLGGEDG